MMKLGKIREGQKTVQMSQHFVWVIMGFGPNHMIQGFLESQDNVVYWTKVLGPLIMSSSYTKVISQKHANT